MNNDGEIDYSNYSFDELLQAERSINREKYPKNYARLQEAIRFLEEIDDSTTRRTDMPDFDEVDTPEEFSVHGRGLSALYLILLIVLVAPIVILLRKRGVIESDSEIAIAVFAISAVFMLLLTGFLRKRAAVPCPQCGKRSMEPDLLSRYVARHTCRACGYRLRDGKPV